MYYITYWIDSNSDGDIEEVHYLISDTNRKQVYTEDVIGGFEDEEDVEWTGLNIARSRDYWPAAVIQDISEIPQTHQSISVKGGKAGKGKKKNITRPAGYYSRIASLPRKRKSANL